MYNFDSVIGRTGTGSLKWDKYRGRDIIPLWVADMDFESPPEILQALHQRVDHGVFGYTLPYDDVISEVLSYLKRQHQLDAEPDWLVWLPGLVPALNVACRAFGKPGDSVMTCTPVYPPFLSAPYFSDRRRITVPLVLENGTWCFDWDALEQEVTPDTKLFILCHPHNPVGRIWEKDELVRILDFCERHDLTLVSDEIHCDLLLDRDAVHVPTLSLGERAAARTITLHAPSKTYNLPGLACSYAVIPDPELRNAFKRAARGMITEVNAFGYAGCAAAYQHGEPWRRELITYLRANRDLVFSHVHNHLPGVTMHPMAATYLAWLDVRELNLDAPCTFFEDAGIGLSNGVDFGAPGFLRLNFGCPRATLQEGLNRMTQAIR